MAKQKAKQKRPQAKRAWIWLLLAVFVGLAAVGWPWIEPLLVKLGFACPWPFSALHASSQLAPSDVNVDEAMLPVYTEDQLRSYDGSDPEKPILLAVGGKVVDVTKGKKFYGVGATYHLFAGRTCTRALTIGSLDPKDLTDDVSDFTDDQRRELEETKKFYYEKYPVVGRLSP